MKYPITKITMLGLSLLVCSSVSAESGVETVIAENNSPCSEFAKECLMLSGAKKTNCFYTKSQHSACESTALGRLLFKRWSYSNSQPAEAMGMALLGPQIMDQECLERFDLSLSTALLSENVAPDYQSFSEALDECSRETPQELVRP